jgi:hypothetical protein
VAAMVGERPRRSGLVEQREIRGKVGHGGIVPRIVAPMSRRER